MKVLHVITHLGPGGIERWLLSMLKTIPREVCAMDFCCKGASVGPYASMASEAGASVHLRPLGVTQIGFVKSLRHLVRKGNYNLVHNHLQVYSGLPVLACRKLPVPVVTSFHCTSFPSDTLLRFPPLTQLRNLYEHMSVNYALRNSALITGCSSGVVDSIENSYAAAGGRRKEVLYYGTDLPVLATGQQRSDFRAAFGWPPGTPIVVHVGRFAAQKNHQGILRIFKAVLPRVPNAKLLLIGGGPLRQSVEAMAGKLGLGEAVRFLGYRDDVPEVLTCADAFLFPSWLEGLGVAVLEAGAAALPVVASNIPPIAEVVDDGVTGFLRDPADETSMVDALTSVLIDRALAARLGSAGRQRIAERFSTRASAQALVRIYDECTSKHERAVFSHAGRPVLGAF